MSGIQLTLYVVGDVEGPDLHGAAYYDNYSDAAADAEARDDQPTWVWRVAATVHPDTAHYA